MLWLIACRAAEPRLPTATPLPATDTAVPTTTAIATATPSPVPTETLEPTLCPQATPELLAVEPLLSPTGLLTQTLSIFLGNSEVITVTAESGVFTTTDDTVEITLLPDTVHHLTVEGLVRRLERDGCPYGGYTLSTVTDRTGAPLIIEQRSDLAPTPSATNQVDLVLVDQIGGASQAVAAAGSIVYLGSGQRVLAIDVTDPGAPQVIGRSSLLPGLVREIELDGDDAYVLAGDSTLQVLDISDPATMPVQAVLTLSGIAQKLAVQNNRLFLAADHFRTGRSEGIFLLALDVSQPGEIKELGRLDILPPPYTTVQSLVVNQDHLYLGGSSEVFVVDAADPTALRLVNQFNTYLSDLALSGSQGYLAGFGLSVLDLSDPVRPAARADVLLNYPATDPDAVRGGPGWLTLNGDDVLMVDWGFPGCASRCRSMVWAMDVTDTPLQPVPVLELDIAATAVAFNEGWVYIAHQNGLIVVDGRQPLTAHLAGSLNTAATLQSLEDGRLAYVSPVVPSDSFQFDPADPAELNALLTLNEWDAAAMIDNYLYVGELATDLTVYDGRDLTDLTAVATVPGEAFDFAVGDGYLYTNGRGEIGVIDIANPAAPRLVTTFDGTTGFAYALATANNYVYVVTSRGLYVLDMNNPAQPAVSTFWPTTDTEELRDVVVMGDYLYLAASQCLPMPPNCVGGGLWVADLSEPATPELVAQLPITTGVDRLVATTEQLYLVTRLAELWMIDITDPLRPSMVAQVPLPAAQAFYELAVANGRLYLYAPDTGWLVYQPAP